jgi:hypothetical protein
MWCCFNDDDDDDDDDTSGLTCAPFIVFKFDCVSFELLWKK